MGERAEHGRRRHTAAGGNVDALTGLHGKTAVITGAGGIGGALALALAREGTNLPDMHIDPTQSAL